MTFKAVVGARSEGNPAAVTSNPLSLAAQLPVPVQPARPRTRGSHVVAERQMGARPMRAASQLSGCCL